MPNASIPSMKRCVLFLAVFGLAGCVSGIPKADPADIPRLEREVAASPDDSDLQVQLGMAQFKAGDFDASLANLQAAVDAGNESGPALLYLGMVQEEQENWSAARDAYNRYLTVGSSGAVRDEVRKRLTLVARNVLHEQAAAALAREAEITAAAQATPRSVAIFPLAFNSDRDDLEPLIYALSDMMVTDFKVSNALIVLERAQVQSLLDEMALTSAGYAEPGTGARAGRMLQAEHVVQGVLTTLGAEDLQTDADILNIPSTSSAGQLTEAAALENLFDMEKQIVIRTIREVLGVELTPAEEQAILENRWDNILAFLAYGRGLRELDNGNYAAAQAEFQTAAQLEPAFQAVDVALAELADLVDASGGGTDDLADIADATGETFTGGFISPPSATTTDDLPSTSSTPASTSTTEEGDETTDPGTTDPTPTGGTLTGTLELVSEGVDPTPTGPTIDLGSSDISGEEETATTDTDRDPIPEGPGGGGGGDTPLSPTEAQIRIIIRRPGGA